jgi:hypothetical protein
VTASTQLAPHTPAPSTPPTPPPPEPTTNLPVALFDRCAWSLVWLGVLTSGVAFWGQWTEWPGAGIVAPVFIVGAMVGMAAVWLVDNPGSRLMQLTAFGSALAAVGVPQAVGIHVRQFYTTDSAAFNQVAAHLLVHGKNPYTHSMAPAAGLLNSPDRFWTYLVNGSYVLHVSYPAGSFLLEAPLMALGFRHEVTDWLDLAAWLVTGVLLFVMMPVSLRWLAALILLASVYVGMFANGGTDVLFLPFLVVAVWRWDRFATGRGAGLAGWVGPICLGLACSIKQTPWFCVPFLAVGVALEARRSGRGIGIGTGARYLAATVAVFVVVNLPFIVWNPSAWARGIVLPLTKGLVADGQGAVTLAVHGLTGGVLLPMLSVAAFLVFVALMVAFVLWYPRMKRVWLLLLPVVLFVPGRSLTSYLIDFFPAAIVAAVTVAAPATLPTTVARSPGATRRWLQGGAVAVPLAAAVAVAVVAFTSAPLTLEVQGFRTSNQTQSLDAVTVTVRNLTGRTVVPHFMVALDANHPAGFWTTSTGRGQVALGPHQTRTVTILPPEYTWSPIRGGYWLVEAYTASPNALSTSPVKMWKLGKRQ